MTAVRNHPVLSYYVIAFAISWGGILLIVGGPSTLIVASGSDSGMFMAGLLTPLAGPPLAGLIVTAVVDGAAGLRRLAWRLTIWRVPARWYAVAIAAAPLSVTVSLLVLWCFSSSYRPGYLAGSPGAQLPGLFGSTMSFALLAGVFTGFLEELGWTGFVMPRLGARNDVLRTGAIMGTLWGAWHLVSNLWGSGDNAQGMPLTLYMAGLLFTFLPPFRVLMVWVYRRTESLIIAMLMHASLVFFWLLSTPPGIAGRPLVTWYAVWGAVLWVAIAILATRSTPPPSKAGARYGSDAA